MINYLFLRKARRRYARIVSIAIELFLSSAREIRSEYIETIRQRFLYRERSKLSSLSEVASIRLKFI